MKLLLDSVILIDHFNGIAKATAFLLEQQEACAVSVITRAEVLAGFRSVDGAAVALSLLDRFPTLGIDRSVADRAAELRRNHRWKLPDAFQAAIAHQHALRLVTRNTRDFPPRRFAFVLVPYRVSTGH